MSHMYASQNGCVILGSNIGLSNVCATIIATIVKIIIINSLLEITMYNLNW